MVRELLKIRRIPKQNLGEELATDEQSDEDLNSTRVFRHVPEQLESIWRVLHESLEIHERRVWRCRGSKRRQQDRNGLSEKLPFWSCFCRFIESLKGERWLLESNICKFRQIFGVRFRRRSASRFCWVGKCLEHVQSITTF